MKISVIIPTFNEENTIIELLKRVKKQSDEGSNLEVIVVDDCSTDNSKKLLTENPDLYNKLILLNKNLGKGGAVREGLLELSAKNSGIKSPIIVIGSSPTALTNLLDLLEESKALPSLVIGMPVGFIGVEKSKQKLLRTNLPRIVMNSTRGGAAMAASVINALLRESIQCL